MKQPSPCWCRCICHTPMLPNPMTETGNIICAHPTRAGKCGRCRVRCNRNAKKES